MLQRLQNERPFWSGGIKGMNVRTLILLGATALAIGSPAFAQSGQDPAASPRGRPAPQPDQWTVSIGIAPVLSPAWQGSKDMALSLFPDLRINYGDTLFASIPDGIGWNALNQQGWKAGPVAKVRFGRQEDRGGSIFRLAGGSDALRGMGDVDAAAELGGFVEKQFGSRRQWRARGEVRQGVGGHEGVIGDVSLAYQGRSGGTAFSLGPRATFVSAGFTETYFGIDPVQSQRSGLPTYKPGGGLLSVGIGGVLVRPLDKHSALTLFTGFERLGNAAARSPLVEQRGSREQFTIGVGYGYRFRL